MDNTAGALSLGGGMSFIGDSSSTAHIANNIVAFNTSGILNVDRIAMTLSHNCVYGNTGFDFKNQVPGSTDILADPLFLNRGNYDYHLTLTSPCVDAGDDSYVYPGETDLDGNARVFGAHVDIGAYEAIFSQFVLTSLTLSPTTVVGCMPSTGKVTLSAPAPADISVSLSTTNPAASLPSRVTVLAGTDSATFSINTAPVTTTKTGSVTATLGSVSKSVTLKVRPIGVKSVVLAPNPVKGGNSVIGKVTLECLAAPGDITVILTSTNPAVATPTSTSLVIPKGAISGTFTVSTADVSVVSYANIKARANGISKSKKLTVNP